MTAPSAVASDTLLWSAIGLALVMSTATLVLALVVTRRIGELREALIRSGVLRRRPPHGGVARGSWLPAPGTPVPPDVAAVTTDGSRLSFPSFAGPDVIVVFLMASAGQQAALADLSAALGAVPADGPRPVVVLNGPSDEQAAFVRALSPLAHVVTADGDKVTGLTHSLRVRTLPAVLVLGGGRVRRASTTIEDVRPVSR